MVKIKSVTAEIFLIWTNVTRTKNVTWTNVRMTFVVQATFVLVTFVHIRNISAVTDPILMKL